MVFITWGQTLVSIYQIVYKVFQSGPTDEQSDSTSSLCSCLSELMTLHHLRRRGQREEEEGGKETTEADEGLRRMPLSCGGRGRHTGGRRSSLAGVYLLCWR